MNFNKKVHKLLVFLLLMSLILLQIACQDSEVDSVNLPARYGESGRTLAVDFSQQFPERYAGSEQEQLAAQWLIKELKSLKLNPNIQEFIFEDASGNQAKSQNIIVEIQGTGFDYIGSETNVDEQIERYNERFIIVGAHYDTPPKEVNADSTLPDSGDGIHNNAAGVASLLTIAKETQKDQPAFNVRLVFFGASAAQYAGAQEYLNSLSQTEINLTEAMYNIDRIYAGDKVYAHAGQNSVISENEKSYEKRKKLYELTDVYYNYLLLTNNDFSLYTNQNVFSMEAENMDEPILYREWTTHLGDHTPFDQVGIPVVYIESFEYNVDSYEELGKESTDPIFSMVDGVIDRSNLDYSVFLNDYYKTLEEDDEELLFEQDDDLGTLDPEESTDQQETQSTLSLDDLRANKHIDRLERRINNVAFLIIKSAQRGDNSFEQK